MGEIVLLQGGKYSYELPTPPSDEKEILNHDRKKDDQIWRIPPMLNFRNSTKSQQIEFINKERDRWLNGVWILIGGELVYITGMHYDHMVYQTFEFGKAQYLDNQREDFYFRDLTRKDDNCFGRVFVKPRRYGMTAQEITEALYTSMEDFAVGVGLMSNEHNKCKTTLLHPIIDSIFKRPKYMRPKIFTPNGKKPRAKLEYFNGKADKDNDDSWMDDLLMLGEGGSREWLGGHIYAYPTTPSAMDGEKKRYITMDEVWKWLGASPEETKDINLKTLRDKRWLGKLSMLSTMGDSDDYVQAVKEGVKIIGQSDPEVRDDNGYTTSKLYEYFVSAIYSHDLPNFYDKFGKLDKARAEEYIYRDRAKLEKGTKKYIFELRRMPLTKAEALMTATNVTIFDKVRLTERLQQLQRMPPKQKPYLRYNLIEDSYGRVSAEFAEDGDWMIAVHPFYSMQRGVDTRNRFRKQGNLYVPVDNPEGGIGYDPIRYEQTTSTNVSRAAIMVAQKFDYYGSGNANRLSALYVKRPDDPEEAHFEAFKACKYWGYPMMYERQVESVLRKARESGMTGFLLKGPDGNYGLWTDNNNKVKGNGVNMIQSRIKKPEKEGEVDRLMEIPWEDAIIDAEAFDPKNSTPFDVMIAWIELEHALLQIHETNIVTASEEGKIVSSVFHAKRTNGAFNS